MSHVRSTAHTVYRINYHFVWTPKYRKKVLSDEIGHRMKEVLTGVAQRYEFEIETMSVQEDHVHVLVSAPPRYAPADLARMMKSVTAKVIFREYPRLKEKEFWGGALWERGYYVGTSGDKVTTDVIQRYIQYRQDQEELGLFNQR